MKTVRYLTMLFIACLAALGVASPLYASQAATTSFHAQASGVIAEGGVPPPSPW